MSYEPTTWARGTKITAQKLNNIERGVESVNSEYTPTTWAEGDIVTATKLNNIEQGIANASGGGGGGDDEIVIIHYSSDNGNLDITWNELNTIIESGKYPIAVSFSQPGGSIIATTLFIENAYTADGYYYGDGVFFSSNGNHIEASAVATSPDELLNISSD